MSKLSFRIRHIPNKEICKSSKDKDKKIKSYNEENCKFNYQPSFPAPQQGTKCNFNISNLDSNTNSTIPALTANPTPTPTSTPTSTPSLTPTNTLIKDNELEGFMDKSKCNILKEKKVYRFPDWNCVIKKEVKDEKSPSLHTHIRILPKNTLLDNPDPTEQPVNPPSNQMNRPPFNPMNQPPINPMNRPPINPMNRPPFNPMNRPPFNPMNRLPKKKLTCRNKNSYDESDEIQESKPESTKEPETTKEPESTKEPVMNNKCVPSTINYHEKMNKSLKNIEKMLQKKQIENFDNYDMKQDKLKEYCNTLSDDQCSKSSVCKNLEKKNIETPKPTVKQVDVSNCDKKYVWKKVLQKKRKNIVKKPKKCNIKDYCNGRGNINNDGSCSCLFGLRAGKKDLYCDNQYDGKIYQNKKCCPLVECNGRGTLDKNGNCNCTIGIRAGKKDYKCGGKYFGTKDLNTDCCPLHDPCHGRGELIEDGSCKCFDGRDKGKVNKYCTKKYINTNNYNIDCCPKKIKKKAKDKCGNKKKKPISKDLLDPESLLKPIVLLKKEKKEEIKKEETKKEETKKEETKKEETKKEEESVKKVSVDIQETEKTEKSKQKQALQKQKQEPKKKMSGFSIFLIIMLVLYLIFKIVTMVFAGRISWNCGYEDITAVRILKTVFFTIFSEIYLIYHFVKTKISGDVC